MKAYQPPPSPPLLNPEEDGHDLIGEWMSELGLAYEEAGDGLVRGGHPREGAEKYEAALSIFTRLAANNPNNNFAASRLRALKAKSAGYSASASLPPALRNFVGSTGSPSMRVS